MKNKTFKIPFDIGDKVFFMNQNQVCEDNISSYNIEHSGINVENTEIYYNLNNHSSVRTDKLFASKEELLKSL